MARSGRLLVRVKGASFFPDDASYIAWRSAHPNGFIGNCSAAGNPNYFFVHRTACHVITPGSSRSNEPGAFTERVFRKVGADEVGPLLMWAEANGRNLDRVRACGVCKPSLPLAAEALGLASAGGATVAGPAASRSGGQGRQMSKHVRKAVELYAMDVVTKYLVDEKWAWENTAKWNPFDYCATRGGERRYVEVKGTTTAGEAVILTAGEVRHARAHPMETMLALVTGIVVHDPKTETPICSGGALRVIEPWVPAEEDLEATVFSYRVP